MFFQDKFLNLCSQVEPQSQPSGSGNDESCTQPTTVDYDTLMIEAVGGRNAKGRVYGLGFDGIMRACASTSKSNQYSNYTDIVRGISGEVEARLRSKIAEQEQTIKSILARQNKLFSIFAKHANIDLDAMDLDVTDLDEDNHSIGNATPRTNPSVGNASPGTIPSNGTNANE